MVVNRTVARSCFPVPAEMFFSPGSLGRGSRCRGKSCGSCGLCGSLGLFAHAQAPVEIGGKTYSNITKINAMSESSGEGQAAVDPTQKRGNSSGHGLRKNGPDENARAGRKERLAGTIFDRVGEEFLRTDNLGAGCRG